MAVEKRNALAVAASMYVPLTADELQKAAQNIRDKKLDDALTCLAEAQIYLNYVMDAFKAALEERAEQES